MPRGGPGGGMPTEAWLFACGFRTVIGKLLELKLPAVAFVADGQPNAGDVVVPPNGRCKVLICEGITVEFGVDLHTAIIGLHPAGLENDAADSALYHVGELVQINLRARSNVALSIERYFTNVSHQSKTADE